MNNFININKYRIEQHGICQWLYFKYIYDYKLQKFELNPQY